MIRCVVLCSFEILMKFANFLPFTIKKIDSKIKTSRDFLAPILSPSNHVSASNVSQVHNAFYSNICVK